MAPPACASRRAIRSFTVTHSPKTESPSVRGAAGHERYKSQSIQDLLSLKGRVTVVTGGARGIGLALAHGAAELGSDVAVLDILDKPIATSVTDAESLSKAFEAVSTDFGRIDNCVTAAGIVCDRPFQETPRDEGMRVLEVNVMGTYLSAQLAVKQMQKQKSGGSIVMIASIAARAAIPSQRLSVYGASKGAIRALCRQLAVELGPLGIRVNSISPGYIETEMTRGLAATNPELLSVFGSAAPLQRMGDRADLKTIAAYLLSDAAAYTTGSDVLVTGGLHAGRF
ncbi:hypothetical protein LTR99_009588 [Exophiala xenobiotica]|nr:hypothetical protein LTR99_009588 [Exophiala xenobiotica]